MKNIICSLGVLFVLLGFSAVAKDQPNILFFFSDDHSLQTLGAYNGRMKEFIQKHNITPNLDKLAEQGMLFENSFVCNSLCGPSRAAILTGKHSEKNGFRKNGDTFDASQWNLAKALKAGGYETVIFGKLHLNAVPDGFDESWVLPGQGVYMNPDFYVNGYGGEKVRKQGYCTDIIGDMTIEWLKKHQGSDKPFFLCSWHKAPHRTWLPPERYYRFLDDVEIPEPDTLFDDYAGRIPASHNEMSVEHELNLSSDLKVTPPVSSSTDEEIRAVAPKTKMWDQTTYDEFARMTDEQKKAWDAYYVPRNKAFREAKLEGRDLVRWKYQQYMKDYLRCVKAMDENVGRVMDYLEKSGLADNTVIVYSSDQGFYNGEHGWYDKRWMYEESFRNPLIVKWPGVTKAGSRVSPMVQNIDYAPTLLDIAGIEVPDAVQGESFKEILEGKTPKNWRKELLYTYYENGGHGVPRHYGIRGERYKLIRFPADDIWEFYDLKTDPSEMKNIYGNVEYAGLIREMKTDLDGLIKTYDLTLSSMRDNRENSKKTE